MLTKAMSMSYCTQVFMLDTEQVAPPTLIFEEHDDRHFVQLTQSKDDSLIMINSNSKTTSEASSDL